MKTRRRIPSKGRQPAKDWLAGFAILSSQPFSEADATAIVNKVRTAHQLLREGKADPQQFVTVGSAINIATIRAEQIGSSEEVQEALWLAGQFLNDCQDRHERTGTFVLPGPGLQAVASGVDLYEQILRASSPRQMQLAAQELWRRVGAKTR